MEVEIYSDIACPWCYIGERRFTRALSAFPQADQVKVIFRPYQLDPALPDAPRPLKERLQEKLEPQLDAKLKHTAAVAAQEGLELRFDEAWSCASAQNTDVVPGMETNAIDESGREGRNKRVSLENPSRRPAFRSCIALTVSLINLGGSYERDLFVPDIDRPRHGGGHNAGKC